MNKPRTLIVGIGSSNGDDQAGWLAVQRLAISLNDDHVGVRQAASPDQLLDWLDGVEHLIICDACRGSGKVGALRRWMWPLPECERARWSSTHGLALPAVLQLIDLLGRLPPRVVIWTVEAAASVPMEALSSQVEAALPILIRAIGDDIHGTITSRKTTCTNSH